MTAKDSVLHRMTTSDFVRRTYRALRSVPVLSSVLSRAVRTAMPEGRRLWARIPAGAAKGQWIYADPRSELGYTYGDHEPWLQDLLQSELSPGGCYYDVGAHSGFFAMIAARCVGPSGAVLAVEPDPKNRAILEANLSRNGLSQVTFLQVAVWSSAGQVTFERAPAISNGTQGHVCDATAADVSGSRIVVSSITLDDLVFSQQYRAPNLIKLDVEGAEWDALQGARRMLAEVRPKLLCEIHHPDQMGQIRIYLEQFGYAAEEWKPVHSHYAEYRQVYLWAAPFQ